MSCPLPIYIVLCVFCARSMLNLQQKSGVHDFYLNAVFKNIFFFFSCGDLGKIWVKLGKSGDLNWSKKKEDRAVSDPHISKSQNRGERERERNRKRRKDKREKSSFESRETCCHQIFPPFYDPFSLSFRSHTFSFVSDKEEKFLGRVLMGHFCHRPLKNVTNEE